MPLNVSIARMSKIGSSMGTVFQTIDKTEQAPDVWRRPGPICWEGPLGPLTEVSEDSKWVYMHLESLGDSTQGLIRDLDACKPVDMTSADVEISLKELSSAGLVMDLRGRPMEATSLAALLRLRSRVMEGLVIIDPAYAIPTLELKDAEGSVVYFIQRGKGGPIKIGSTCNIRQRQQTLQVASPETLEVLATTPGDLCLEKFYQRMFRDCEIRGEWFQPKDALYDLIACLRESNL